MDTCDVWGDRGKRRHGITMIDNLYKCALVQFSIIKIDDLRATGIDGGVLWDYFRDIIGYE